MPIDAEGERWIAAQLAASDAYWDMLARTHGITRDGAKRRPAPAPKTAAMADLLRLRDRFEADRFAAAMRQRDELEMARLNVLAATLTARGR